MRAAARVLEGRHDFRAFGNAGSPRKTTVRTLQRLRVVARRERLAFVVQGDGFLYNMVRTLAGTLLDVGLLVDAGSRKSGKRDEALYELVAPTIGFSGDTDDPAVIFASFPSES